MAKVLFIHNQPRPGAVQSAQITLFSADNAFQADPSTAAVSSTGFALLYNELQDSSGIIKLSSWEQSLLSTDPITLTFLLLSGQPLPQSMSPQIYPHHELNCLAHANRAAWAARKVS